MKGSAIDTGNAGASAAIERVLQAEREARDAVASCEREARALVEEAHRHALRVAERTTARIAAARARVTMRVADAARQCEAQAAALPVKTRMDPADDQRIAPAVAAVAAELTGEAP
jgi:hypothetical protein